MVKAGKLTTRQLDMVRRWEARDGNCVEGFSFFVGGVVSVYFYVLELGDWEGRHGGEC